MREPVISIICNAFNHEKYIAQALESFLMQKVSVPIEILIHDDASTDSTADIIREYADKYKDIIKPIFQRENQYSKGVGITPTYQLSRAKGKYIAFCEGDDYWIDVNKLQIQYDFMEENEQYSICTHAYDMVNKDGTFLEHRNDLSADGVVPMKMLIGNQLAVPHFATMFVRAECLSDFSVPFLQRPCSDMIIRLFCATKKDIYYMNRNMSAYRRFTESSWTVTAMGNKQKFLEGQQKVISFLADYNEYTNYKYDEIINEEIDTRTFMILFRQHKYRDAKKSKGYAYASKKHKIAARIGCIFPKFVKLLQEKR